MCFGNSKVHDSLSVSLAKTKAPRSISHAKYVGMQLLGLLIFKEAT